MSQKGFSPKIMSLYQYLFIYLLYFARTSYNKLQRLMDNEKEKEKEIQLGFNNLSYLALVPEVWNQ